MMMFFLNKHITIGPCDRCKTNNKNEYHSFCINLCLYLFFSLERAKEHVAQNPTRLSSLHNDLAARAVTQGRTLVNEPSLVVKC